VLLAAAALILGIYHIATTVMIAEDGVDYIYYARALSAEPLKVLGDPSAYAGSPYPPGYPAIIAAAYRLSCLLGAGGTLPAWIHSAQAATLACRILALVLMYFIALEFFGAGSAFWAVLVLAVLPYPARIGADVLRDWPHLFLLAGGFLVLLSAARLDIWWLFGIAGVVSGLGYLVRPSSVQLVAYGIVWICFCLAGRPGLTGLSRGKLLAALAVLAGGFLAVAVPYSIICGRVLPYRIHEAVESLSADSAVRHQYCGLGMRFPAGTAKKLTVYPCSLEGCPTEPTARCPHSGGRFPALWGAGFQPAHHSPADPFDSPRPLRAGSGGFNARRPGQATVGGQASSLHGAGTGRMPMPASLVAATGTMPRAMLLLARRLAEHFSYYFLPFALVGLYRWLREGGGGRLKLLLLLFLLANAALPVARHICFAASFSRRYLLPLAAFLAFFVPTGLGAAGCRIAEYVRRLRGGKLSSCGSSNLYFLALLAIGIAVCMPRLLRPVRSEKKGYLSAAGWLRRNMAIEEKAGVPDARIAFYADRKARKLRDGDFGAGLDFVVRKVKLWGELERKVCYCDVNIVGHPLYGTDRVIEYLLLGDFKDGNPAEATLRFAVPEGRPRSEFRLYVFGRNDCEVELIELTAAGGQAIDILGGGYELASQTGLVDYQRHRVRAEDAREGFLVYGPYMPLDPGPHTIRFRVRLNNPLYWEEVPPGTEKAAEFYAGQGEGGDKLVIYRRR
jgi:hypothetical protein